MSNHTMTLLLRSFFCLLFFPSLVAAQNKTAQKFVHPGVIHSQESIDFVKTKIAAKEEPWASAWNKLKRSRYASMRWTADPVPHVERGAYNNPNIGSSDFSHDSRAAYTHALHWALSDEPAHAKKASEIIDSWTKTLKSITNHDARLLIGMSGQNYIIAAELLRHTWDQWPKENQARFEKMLREIWYPVIKDFHPSANGNWDASMEQTMIAIGVFLDDHEIFNRAVNYYLKGKGNGAIGMYFKASGQC